MQQRQQLVCVSNICHCHSNNSRCFDIKNNSCSCCKNNNNSCCLASNICFGNNNSCCCRSDNDNNSYAFAFASAFRVATLSHGYQPPTSIPITPPRPAPRSGSLPQSLLTFCVLTNCAENCTAQLKTIRWPRISLCVSACVSALKNASNLLARKVLYKHINSFHIQENALAQLLCKHMLLVIN